jgi:DNA-binding NtrC family response regulator
VSAPRTLALALRPPDAALSLNPVFELTPASEPEHRCADIVLVEPDPRVVARLYEHLDAEGHRVRTAGSVAAARLHIARRRPTLLIAAGWVGEDDLRHYLPALAAEGLAPPTLAVGAEVGSAVEAEFSALATVRGTLPDAMAVEAVSDWISEFFREGGEQEDMAKREDGANPTPAP